MELVTIKKRLRERIGMDGTALGSSVAAQSLGECWLVAMARKKKSKFVGSINPAACCMTLSPRPRDPLRMKQ
eukprot:5145206-Amphidinium_carterae.1